MELVKNIECILTITPHGKENKVINIALKHHCGAKYTFLGKGTINDRISKFLGIDHDSRDVVLTFVQKKESQGLLDELNDKLHLKKPGNGIAVSFKINQFIMEDKVVYEKRGLDNMEKKNSLVVSIVNYGDSETIINSAREAGAIGATILKGHGTAMDSIPKILGFAIEPEKEIILMVVEMNQQQKIIDSIINNNEGIKPVIFSVDLNNVYGVMDISDQEKLNL